MNSSGEGYTLISILALLIECWIFIYLGQRILLYHYSYPIFLLIMQSQLCGHWFMLPLCINDLLDIVSLDVLQFLLLPIFLNMLSRASDDVDFSAGASITNQCNLA